MEDANDLLRLLGESYSRLIRGLIGTLMMAAMFLGAGFITVLIVGLSLRMLGFVMSNAIIPCVAWLDIWH